MFSHQMVGSNDLDRSKRFYDAIFTAVGGPEGIIDPLGRLIYLHKGARFMITRPINGALAEPGNGTTIGLAMDNPEQADSWYAAGMVHGGTPVEDPPGWRARAAGRLYLAYLRDPDGNKLCAIFREEA